MLGSVGEAHEAQMPTGMEIERKYLLASAPSGAELADLGARPRRIEQDYLR
jgi:hypothetical protein